MKLAFHPDLAGVSLDHLLYDVKPQAGSADPAGSIVLDSIELLKQVGDFAFWNSKAGVFDADDETTILEIRRRGYGDLIVCIGVLDGIGDEIVQDLVQTQLVGPQLWGDSGAHLS